MNLWLSCTRWMHLPEARAEYIERTREANSKLLREDKPTFRISLGYFIQDELKRAVK